MHQARNLEQPLTDFPVFSSGPAGAKPPETQPVLEDLERYFDRGGKLDTESFKRYFRDEESLSEIVAALASKNATFKLRHRNLAELLSNFPFFPFNATETMPGQKPPALRRVLALQKLEQFFERGGTPEPDLLRKYFPHGLLADMAIALYLKTQGASPQIESTDAQFELVG